MWTTIAVIQCGAHDVLSVIEKSGQVGLVRQSYSTRGVSKAGEFFSKDPAALLCALSGNRDAQARFNVRRESGKVTLSNPRHALQIEAGNLPELLKALSEMCRTLRRAKP